MKIYKYNLEENYSDGVILVLANDLEEAESIVEEYDEDANWVFNEIIEHLSSTLTEPQIILQQSYSV
jgi:hypothetical protein